MISRRQQPRQNGRHLKQVALKLAAVTIACAAATLSTTAAAATTGQPPAALFRPGYDLCHAASLAAIRRAGDQHYKAGTFSHAACTWQRSDLRAGIVLSTHPTAVGRALMRMFKAQSGKHHMTARTIKVPLASKALLVTFPSGASGQLSKYLFAAYRKGVIQVNMTAPKSLPTKRLRAVLKVVSR
jgi:hypothetical protein